MKNHIEDLFLLEYYMYCLLLQWEMVICCLILVISCKEDNNGKGRRHSQGQR